MIVDIVCSLQYNMKGFTLEETSFFRVSKGTWMLLDRSMIPKDQLLSHSCEKPYKCDLCDYATHIMYNLMCHMWRHTGVEQSQCHHCDPLLQNTSVSVCQMTGTKIFGCNLCNYSTARKDHIKTHMLWHTGAKPYKCHLCDYSTYVKWNLRSHEKYRHPGLRPHQCRECGKCFPLEGDLKKHSKVHEIFPV